MDRIALQILEDGWEQDGRAMRRAIVTLRDRLAESTDGRWAAAAFEINRIYNILEKAFERLCESFENHLRKTGRYHDTLIERVTLDLKGIRPAFLPGDAVRDVRELIDTGSNQSAAPVTRTSPGRPDDFGSTPFRRRLANALRWAARPR